MSIVEANLNYFDMPNVSTCRVTDGAPLRMLAGPVNVDVSERVTLFVSEVGQKLQANKRHY